MDTWGLNVKNAIDCPTVHQDFGWYRIYCELNGIHLIQVTNQASDGIHPSFEKQGRRHHNPKQEYPWFQAKD